MRWRVKWPDGVVLLRVTSEPVPFFGQQLSEGAPKHLRPPASTCCGRGSSRLIAGGLPFAVSGAGPWDPEPDGGFQPDVLAARLVAFVSGWCGPDGPLTDDQREWFSWPGPEANLCCPARRAPRWSG